MPHDLIAFPGVRVSLTSIHGIANEIVDGTPTGNVYIDYGHGCRIAFEGSVEDVMEIIDAYCGV